MVWLQPKHGVSARTVEQDVWLREATMSVSCFFAFMAYCMMNKFRQLQDRVHSFKMFKLLLQKLCAVTEGFTIEAQPCLGAQSRSDLLVDSGGSVDSKVFWSGQFYQSSVAVCSFI